MGILTGGGIRHEMDVVLPALRQDLGFRAGDVRQEQVCQPYIEYIQASWTGRGEQQDFLRLFSEVVRHFRGTTIFRVPSFLKPMTFTKFLGGG